jgi:hypothetical protein
MEKVLSTVNVKFVCILLSFLFFLPNLFGIQSRGVEYRGTIVEEYKPALVQRIRSIDDLLEVADSISKSKHIKLRTLGYAEVISDLVRNRFFHEYCYYSINENWVAALAGRLVWDHLSAIVLPDDILKYPMAACSQQCIVLAESFKRKGIDYRKVGFDHHFALEAKLDNQWFYFDPDGEPDFSKVPRNSINSLFKSGIYEIYKKNLDSSKLKWALAGLKLGKVNDALAPNATIFHIVTKLSSRIFFIIPLMILFIFNLKQRRKINIVSNKKYELNKKICVNRIHFL